MDETLYNFFFFLRKKLCIMKQNKDDNLKKKNALNWFTHVFITSLLDHMYFIMFFFFIIIIYAWLNHVLLHKY